MQVLDAGRAMLPDDEDAMEDVVLTRLVFQHGQRPRRPRTVRSVALDPRFIFRLSTGNPRTHPLLYPHLLQLHAAVMRVCRAAGMASEVVEAWDDGDEDTGASMMGTGQEVDPMWLVTRYLAALEDAGTDVAT